MALLKNIQNLLFWKNVLKISLPFLLIVAVFSLLFNTGKAIFSGDWHTVYEYHFANNRWIRFWLSKFVISIFYGIYITNKNMK